MKGGKSNMGEHKLFLRTLGLAILAVHLHAQTIEVHLDTDLGECRHAASGFLHGFARDGLSPEPSVVEPLNINIVRYPAGRMGMTERFVEEGYTLHPLFSDDWGYSDDPGVNNWADWEALVEGFVTEYTDMGLKPLWDIWNEPDHGMFWHWSREHFFETWRRAYVKIREIDPDALIVGPSWSGIKPLGDTRDQFLEFLQFAKDNNVVPDYICWHFPGNYVEEADECRQIINDMQLDVQGIIINEIIVGTEYTGQTAWHLCQVERAGIDWAMHACWDGCVDGNCCFNSSLDGILVGSNGPPTGKYYAYEMYARVTGTMVETVPSGSMELYAGKDPAAGQASVFFGSPDWHDNITVRITGLSAAPYLLNNGAVRVIAEKITATEPQEECTADKILTVIDEEMQVDGDILEINIPWNGMYYTGWLQLSNPDPSTQVLRTDAPGQDFTDLLPWYDVLGRPAFIPAENRRRQLQPPLKIFVTKPE
jgi:hypothetical protein